MSRNDPLSAVEPDLRAALAAMPNFNALTEERLPAMRAILQGEPALLGADGTLTVSRVFVSSRHGAADIPALLYQPTVAVAVPLPALLNIHGGGFVAGSAHREDAAMRNIAKTLGCVVLSTDYRLAPESPFPAAIEDCDSALYWLHGAATELCINVDRIAVRGVSAGGGLALGLAVMARDRGGPPISFLQLIYPMLDDRTGEHPCTGKFVWTAAANRFGWDAVLRGQDRASPPPYSVPGRAQDLASLPPIFLAVGAIDLFVGEILSLATRLVDAGVSLELHIYPGAYHGFSLVAESRAAKTLVRDSNAALSRAMHER